HRAGGVEGRVENGRVPQRSRAAPPPPPSGPAKQVPPPDRPPPAVPGHSHLGRNRLGRVVPHPHGHLLWDRGPGQGLVKHPPDAALEVVLEHKAVNNDAGLIAWSHECFAPPTANVSQGTP